MIHDRAFAAVTLVALTSSTGDTIVLPGPAVIMIAGVSIHVMSAALGLIGVVLGHLLSPPASAALTRQRAIALFVTLLLLELTIVMATGQAPIVAMGWGIGLGFSGYTVAATLGSQAQAGIKTISDAFIDRIARQIGGKRGEGKNGE